MDRASQSHETKQPMRGAMIALHEEGLSYSAIANRLGVNRATVSKWVTRFRAQGHVQSNLRSGAPCCTTLIEDEEIIRSATDNPLATAVQISRNLNLQCDLKTVRNRLRAAGIKHHSPAVKPQLTQQHKDWRLGFALENFPKDRYFILQDKHRDWSIKTVENLDKIESLAAHQEVRDWSIKTEENLDLIEDSPAHKKVFDELPGSNKSINMQEADMSLCYDVKFENDFIKEEHSFEASFDNYEVFEDLTVNYSPIAIKETVSCNDVKFENHFVKQEHFIEASPDDSEPIINSSLKIHLKPKEEKTGLILTSGDISHDCIYRECLPIKYGTYYIHNSEGSYKIYYRDNFVLKITNQFTRRTCSVSLSKLKLGNFSCDQCYNSFYSIEAKKCHLCECNLTGDVSEVTSFNGPLKDFNCLQCNKSFHKKFKLNSHVFSVHKKIKDKMCSQCSSKFSYNYELKYHILYVHTKNKVYKCLKCPASYCRKVHLTQHVARVHERLKPHKCLRCAMSFQNNYDLYRHTSSVHLNLQPYQCADCSKGFTRKSSLSKHIASVHLNLRNYSCSECSSTFTRKDCLSSHIKIQHSIKKCSQCDSKFCDDHEVKAHISNFHTKKKTYNCNKCPASFSNKHRLTHHYIAVHENIGPHKSFANLKDFDLHHSSDHLKLNFYQCCECSKKFTRSDDLRNHVSMHRKLGKYSCTECNSTFTRNDSLKNHLIIKHNLKRCSQCKK